MPKDMYNRELHEGDQVIYDNELFTIERISYDDGPSFPMLHLVDANGAWCDAAPFEVEKR